MKHYRSPTLISHDLLDKIIISNNYYENSVNGTNSFRFSTLKEINMNKTNNTYFEKTRINHRNKSNNYIDEKIINNSVKDVKNFTKKILQKTILKNKSITIKRHNISSSKNLTRDYINNTNLNKTLNKNIKFNSIKNKMKLIFNKFNNILMKINIDKLKKNLLSEKKSNISLKLNKTTKFNNSYNPIKFDSLHSKTTNENIIINNLTFTKKNINEKSIQSALINSSKSINFERMNNYENKVIKKEKSHFKSSKFIKHNKNLRVREIDKYDEISNLIKEYLNKPLVSRSHKKYLKKI